ncbi:MAG: hypothetical protein HYY13_11570 [Nitrospirae bacterium]|nr:hypothetical protein [Nitrospirota bacterium]
MRWGAGSRRLRGGGVSGASEEAVRLHSIGEMPWTRGEMIDSLFEFCDLYSQRPIRDNRGGMRAPHMFLAWFALTRLKPKAIIESGVWRGQGTWLFERACPDAALYCIDPSPELMVYRSTRATYFTTDFSDLDWSSVPRADTVVFVDDHVNNVERLRSARKFGFFHLLFEDNYPPFLGQNSLKTAFMHGGYCEPAPPPATLVERLRRKGLRLLGRAREADNIRVPGNTHDADELRRDLEVYCELPPVFKSARTRWGEPWDDRYPTPEPLLGAVSDERLRVFQEEADTYTWLCYARLKGISGPSR